MSVGLLLASAQTGGLFQSLRLGSTDFLHGDAVPWNQVIIVAIDDASIEQYGSWPWPHSLHTQLIKKIDQARIVGIDILFDEVTDPALIDAVDQSGNIVLVEAAILTGKTPRGIIQSVTSLSSPPDLQAVAAGSGIVNTAIDPDGVIRRVPLLIQSEGLVREAFSLQLLRHFWNFPPAATAELVSGYIQFDTLQLPVDPWGRMTIRFAGEPESFNYVSAADVLSGVVSGDIFNDKIVLLGQMNLTGGVDEHDVPTSHGTEEMSGVEIQANIIQTIAQQQFLKTPARSSELITIITMSMLGGLILFRFRFWGGIPFLFLVEGVFLLYAAFLFDRGVLIDLFYPSLSLAVSYVVAVAVDNAGLLKKLKLKHIELTHTYDATLQGWARALELRDYETKGHTIRVTKMTVELAELMGVDKEELVHVARGATLHDIGKIGIPDSILLKPGKLTAQEWAIMQQHPRYGYEMILPIDYLKPALDIVLYHHEKWDGSGYPDGLKGVEIPLVARIFSVVDVWDALTFDRPYRKAVPPDKVLTMIQEDAGTHFDPLVVDIFSKYIRPRI